MNRNAIDYLKLPLTIQEEEKRMGREGRKRGWKDIFSNIRK